MAMKRCEVMMARMPARRHAASMLRAAAEHEAAGDEAAIGQGLALDVLEHRPGAAMQLARIEDGAEQRLVGLRGLEHHRRHDVVELAADLAPAPATLDVVGERDH